MWMFIGIIWSILFVISITMIMFAIFKYDALDFDDFDDNIFIVAIILGILFIPLLNLFISSLTLRDGINDYKKEHPIDYEKKYIRLTKMLIKQKILTDKQIEEYIGSFELMEKLSERQ